MDKTRSLIKSNSYSRRQVLIETMNGLETEEITCANCPGHCCTFVGNSMQMTTVEALDLYFYLADNDLWNEELEEKLKENIKEFRLDHRPSIGGGHFMRKTYTCPFFLFQSKGCPIPPQFKPYGCLGFNPSQQKELEGKSCSSSQVLLEAREEAVKDEERECKNIRESLHLAWDKETIPSALLDIRKAILALSLQQ